MLLRRLLLFLAAIVTISAQTPGERELTRALTAVEDLRKQVDVGVAPRARLEAAEQALADARDADLLARTLYGTELTEEQSGDMEAAAQRRVDRRRAEIARLQVLVDAGALPLKSVDAAASELSWAERELGLAASRADLVRDLAALARAEQQAIEAHEAAAPGPAMERFDGDGTFTRTDLKAVLLAFEKQFKKPLPISAHGETSLHRALGFDHRDRVDVALAPDTPEGAWLRQHLEAGDIPYYAFRTPIPGKATAAHIHIGPPSLRIVRTD
jgi:hypothetical protein